MAVSIKFENVSKQYRLGLVSTKTISHDLNRWWQTSVLKKEDPYLKIGEVNNRATKGTSDYVWALRDINFQVEQGDVLGIIGKNGAGKSTLLKILSKVTTPTTGSIKAKGRIASLLEVGTGFHPELTGKENIYMNGAIMGMTKAEITRKLDEIVDFAGVERYLDTPVKRYSSGMRVRLGFAIAAHLDPEILVVDEVLAVGDAEFQKKAIGKMQDVSKGEGRTVLFVSHNMTSVLNLCTKGVLLEDGMATFSGSIEDTVDRYLSSEVTHEGNFLDRFAGKDLPEAYLTSIHYEDERGNKIGNILSGSKVNIVVGYHSELNQRTNMLIGISNSMSGKILQLGNVYAVGQNTSNPPKDGKFIFSFDKFPLPEGVYSLDLNLWIGKDRKDRVDDNVLMNVIMADFYGSGRVPPATENRVFVDYNWRLEGLK